MGLKQGEYVLRRGQLKALGRQDGDFFVVLSGSQIKLAVKGTFGHPDLERMRADLQRRGMVQEGEDGIGTIMEDVSTSSGHKAASFVLGSDVPANFWLPVENEAVAQLVSSILDAYSARRDEYAELLDALRTELESGLEALGEQEPISFTLQSRTKSMSSLEGKLRRKLLEDPLHYESLREVTDLAGIRFLVYEPARALALEQRISQVLGEQTAVGDYTLDGAVVPDWDRKPVSIDEDRWYNASHLTVSYSTADDDFPLSCEIQVTDIMSHVINEIGHDLIYKNQPTIDYALGVRIDASKTVARLMESFRALFKNLESAQDSVARVAVLADQVRQVKMPRRPASSSKSTS